MSKIDNIIDALSSGRRKAYKGSPYDHDAFDQKWIGKHGLGRGHGHYFSSKREIAKYYRDSLRAYPHKFKVRGVDVENYSAGRLSNRNKFPDVPDNDRDWETR